MRLTFLGGGREIGASSALLELEGKRIVIDAGLRPSPRPKQSYLPAFKRLQKEFNGRVDLVCVTHAHLDHVGGLPTLLSTFPHLPCVTTEGTFALMRVMLPKNLEVAERLAIDDARAATELERRPEVITAALKRTMMTTFGRWFTPFPDAAIRLGFFPAGHILGAAMVAVEGEGKRVLFTGDFSVSRQATVPGWEPFDFSPDVLVTEATYGCVDHTPRVEQETALANAVRAALARGGRVLIPAFAVGRSQEILALLHRWQQQGDMPAVPVYYDGLVRDTTRAYIDAGLVAQFVPGGTIHAVTTGGDRESLMAQSDPSVIVASSGNLRGGPAALWAERLLPDAQNAVFLSGYQDEEAPGRELTNHLMTHRRPFRIGEKEVAVEAMVALYHFSAHADREELRACVDTLRPKVVVVNHGEPRACAELAEAVRSERPVWLPDNEIVFDPLVDGREQTLGGWFLPVHGAAPVQTVPREEAKIHKAAKRHLTDYTLPELLAHVRPVQERLGIQFVNEGILLRAFIHRSFVNETRVAGLEHNELLEFLGDAVLEYAVTKHLFRRFRTAGEGVLTNVRATLVNADVLADLGDQLGLGPYVLVSRGEAREWVRHGPGNKASRFILANVLEAVIGAIHEDRGLGVAELFVSDVLMPRLDEVARAGFTLEIKSTFQEIAQSRRGVTPTYRVTEDRGPGHNKWFTVECLVGKDVAGRGEGSSQKEAEFAAAADALFNLFGLKPEDLRVSVTHG